MDNQDKKRKKGICKQNKVYCFIYCFTNPPFTNPLFTNPSFTNPRFTNPRFTNPRFTNPVHILQIQSTPLQSMFYHMPSLGLFLRCKYLFTTFNNLFLVTVSSANVWFLYIATKAFLPCESEIRTKILMTDMFLLVGS